MTIESRVTTGGETAKLGIKPILRPLTAFTAKNLTKTQKIPDVNFLLSAGPDKSSLCYHSDADALFPIEAPDILVAIAFDGVVIVVQGGTYLGKVPATITETSELGLRPCEKVKRCNIFGPKCSLPVCCFVKLERSTTNGAGLKTGSSLTPPEQKTPVMERSVENAKRKAKIY